MPVPWAEYVFPGETEGFSSHANAAVSTLPDPVSISATGGSKQIPFLGEEPVPAVKPILNKLNVTFEDPTYFTYGYLPSGAAGSAQAQLRASANFKVGGSAHTISQLVAVNPDTQEVFINPAVTSNEFE